MRLPRARFVTTPRRQGACSPTRAFPEAPGFATLRDRDYTLARAGWIGDYEDPNTFLDIWVSEGGNNQTGWGDPTYDRLIAAAGDIERFVSRPSLDPADLQDGAAIETSRAAILAESDPMRRKVLGGRLRMRLLAEAEHILVAEAFPIIPIYFYVVSGLVRPEVEGFYTELEFDDGSRGANLRDIHPLRAIRMSGSTGGARNPDKTSDARDRTKTSDARDRTKTSNARDRTKTNSARDWTKTSDARRPIKTSDARHRKKTRDARHRDRTSGGDAS